MKQIVPEIQTLARIKVIGVGGAGSNAVDHMIRSKVKNVEFIVVNTDVQDLTHSLCQTQLHIGKTATRGLGAGMNPDLGRQAAEESVQEIEQHLRGSDMVFVAYGAGGGSGTGAGPIVAGIARGLGALTVGVITKPFTFEGSQRARIAEDGIAKLVESVDSMILIPNDRILGSIEKETPLKEAFALCDEVLRQGVQGISDLITMPGIINVDFADVRAILSNAGSAVMGIGRARGDKRAEVAAKAAVSSALLDLSIDGARGLLFAISGGEDLSMWEIQEAANIITQSVDRDARVIFGAVQDESLRKGEVKITVVAAGFPQDIQPSSTLFSTKQIVEAAKGTNRPAAQVNMLETDANEELDSVPAYLRKQKRF